MEEENVAQPDPSPPGAPSRADAAEEEGISTVRKVRLIVLVCILAVLAVVTLAYRAKERRDAQRRQEALATALTQLREAVGGLAPSADVALLRTRIARALQLWERVGELDPGNQEADRLAVAFTYAGGNYGEALRLFNTFDVRQMATELDRDVYVKATRVLSQFPGLTNEAGKALIGPQGESYLRQCGVLWRLARNVAKRATTQREKALLLCRWFALMLWPERLADVPADPYMVLWRGYGSPPELTWTYAELARQLNIRSRVLVLPAPPAGASPEYLVQVYPDEGEPFLVSPARGVPVLDPDSARTLSLAALQERPAAYGAFLALAGDTSPLDPARFKDAQLKDALEPFACFPRFLVLNHLLGPLPEHPQLGVTAETLPPEGDLDLWAAPLELLIRISSQQYARRSAEAYGSLQMTSQARVLQYQGLHGAADARYDAILADVAGKLSAAEVPRAAALLKDAADYGAFFRAANSFESGDHEKAEKLLRAYLSDQPDGAWRVLARLQLAEILSEKGDREAAAALWEELP
ncbi:MAG: tetratricopeptide repeat protein, partial [Planctomycetota bacterium]